MRSFAKFMHNFFIAGLAGILLLAVFSGSYVFDNLSARRLSVSNGNSKLIRSLPPLKLDDDSLPIGEPERLRNRLRNVLKYGSIIFGGLIRPSSSIASSAPSLVQSYIGSINNGNEDLIPKITAKVYLDVRIANYTEESVGKNKPGAGSGRLVVGLFGNDAPTAVKYFIECAVSNGSSFPSFEGAQFTKVDENNVLQLDRMRGLEIVNIAGMDQYEYRGKLLTNFDLFRESNSLVKSHNRRGLLTRERLTSTPQFGITLSGNNAEALDQYHEVFGIVLEGYEVLDSIESIPRYTYKTKTGYAGTEKGVESALADSWFENQKKFYVGVGQIAGDKRAVDQRGKILKRVSVRNCGLLN